MKILVLIAGGRAGIDFFQSLLDGHAEISQFPGIFFYDEFWLKSRNVNQSENIAKMFINDYKHFFDSRTNLLERHNTLGKDKKSFYLVNKDLFIKHFIDLTKDKNLNQKDLLCCLNLAYSQASGEDLSKKKIIVLHLHHIFRIKFLNKLDFEIIYSIRDPLANYTSVINHWFKYQGGRHITPWSYYFNMDRFFNGLKDSINSKKKTHVVQLEKLHTENVKVMKDFCSIFNITYNDSMTQSTFHCKKWWGDQLSSKYLDGVNPNFENNIDRSLFFNKDIECLETYLRIFLLKYNYPLRSNGLRYTFLKYLPFKAELKVWRDAITSFNIKLIMSILIYWVKRVNLMNKKIHDNVNFPNPIGKKIIN